MGNCESGNVLHSLNEEFAQNCHSVTEGAPPRREAPLYVSKQDECDSDYESFVPQATSTFKARALNELGIKQTAASMNNAKPRVSTLSVSMTVMSTPVGQRIEKSAQILRTSNHPGLFRVVTIKKTKKMFSCVGVPQVEWLVSPEPSEDAKPAVHLNSYTVSEILYGVSSILSAVEHITQTQQLIFTDIGLRHVAVALHRGRSCRTLDTVETDDWIDGSAVHHGRWLLNDLSMLEPPNASTGVNFGTTLRSVAIFVLDVLSRLLQDSTLQSELLAVVQHSLMLLNSHSSSDTGGHGDTLHPISDFVDRQMSESEMHVVNRGDEEQHVGDQILCASPAKLSAGDTLVALRSLESSLSQLLEDLRFAVSKTSTAPPSSSASHRSTSERGESADTPSSSPSRSAATPLPNPFNAEEETPSTFAAQAILHWLQFALLDASNGAVSNAKDAQRCLQQLRHHILVGLGDPLCVLLHHGESLYLYEAEDEHSRSGKGGQTTSSLALDGYEAMKAATVYLQSERTDTAMLETNASFDNEGTTTNSKMRRGPRSCIWERRILPWLMHPCHMAQREASGLMDFIFSTRETPRPLLCDKHLSDVAVCWLVHCTNVVCRTAALRYARWLVPALPPPELSRFLTTSCFVFFQSRICLRLVSLTSRAASEGETSTNGPAQTNNDRTWSPIHHSAATLALSAARAYAQATVPLVETLFSAASSASSSSRKSTLRCDRDGCRKIIQEVLLKELLLLVKECVAVHSEDLMMWSSSVYQGISKTVRQCLFSLAELAAPSLKKLSGPQGSFSNVSPSVLTLVAALAHGMYYGSIESRERILTLFSAMMLSEKHPPAVAGAALGPGAANELEHVPCPAILIMRWWLPLVTPLCASRDTRVRVAACQAAGGLVRLMRRDRDTAMDSDGPDTIALQDAFTMNQQYEEDLHGSHGTYEWACSDPSLGSTPSSSSSQQRTLLSLSLQPDALREQFAAVYHKRVYLPCFQVLTNKFVQSLPSESSSASAVLAVPSKDLLVSSEGRSVLWCSLHGRTNVDDALLPQPYFF